MDETKMEKTLSLSMQFALDDSFGLFTLSF